VGELYANYAILEYNLVPGRAGHLQPLEPVSGRVGYTMANQRLAAHPLTFQSIFLGAKPTQVDTDFICYVLYDIVCDSLSLPQYHDMTVFAELPPPPTTPAHQKPLMLQQTLIDVGASCCGTADCSYHFSAPY
jgi:hypothetical protein